MKFSYNWIRDLVEGLDANASELSRLVTMKTAESEGVEHVGDWFTKVVAARVLEVEEIPKSKNRKAVVDIGAGTKTVACGAPNCRPGMVTAYVPSGTMLGEKEIRRAMVSGIESDGMLAAGDEIGINREHEGILELDLAPGDPLPCEPDSIIEIDNKSLTHRPDLWGHYGMAREVAGFTHKRLLDPVKIDLIPRNTKPVINVNIESFDQCPRYSALVFENVTVKPSPLWLQYRLQSIGLNPINNIVDLTNFVMSELAQPMHAFDADKVQGHTIFVRQAKDGESFAALNDEQYKLSSSNMVIADEAGPIALAGVIGGRDSAISESTTRIILESACFNAVSVRKTSSAIKLRTDASMRFEKSQDPSNTVRGLARAIALLREVSPAIQIAGGISDSYRPLKSAPPIELPLDWLDRKLGRALTAAEVKSILEALEFGVTEPSPRVFSVTVPSSRATKDISMKDDLVEEVGRMVGYESITPTAPSLAVTVPPRNHNRLFHNSLRQMTAAQGFDEVYNYSFLSEDLARKFDFDPGEHVAVKNPIAADQSLMRISLIPGIWKNVIQNAKYFESFRLFEIGKEIHKRSGDLPLETTRIAAAIYSKGDGVAEIFELKRLAECIASGIEVKPASSTRKFEHPARTVDVIFKKTTIGRLFEMHPSFVEHGRAAILEINVDQLGELRATDRRYQAIQRFPSSAFDLSVVTRMRQPIGDIQQLLAPLAGPNLQQMEFVRQYAGPQLAEGMKSVTFRFTLASPDHTLSAEEVGFVREQIIEGMRTLGYELRV